MRNKFGELLETLHKELVDMGALCEQAVRGAIRELEVISTGSDSAAKVYEEVFAAEREIDRKERDIESLCLRLILRQQPVAGDLRFISAALKLISDMERIGDQALDIGELLLPYSAQLGSVGGIRDLIMRMSGIVTDMIRESVDAFVRRDRELAQSVIRRDDEADGCFLQVKEAIVEIISRDRDSGAAALDLLLIAKYLERVGDHAVNIAEWAEFLETGMHKGRTVV